MEAFEYTMAFVLGGGLVAGSKAATDKLDNPLLGAALASLPLQYISVLFINNSEKFKPYFLSSVLIEIAVVLSFVATWAIMDFVQSKKFPPGGERACIILFGVFVWLALSLIVYFSTLKWPAIQKLTN
jgi:hypothetical protein